MEERVAITGLGAISPAGVGKDALLQALLAGTPSVVEEEVAPGEVRPVGRVGELTPTAVRLQSSKASQIDVVSRYAVEACGQALLDSGLEMNDELRARSGVLIGTAFGCFESNVLFDQYWQSDDGRLMDVSPLLFKSTVANAAAGWVSILLKLRGINATFVSGRTAAAEALGHGFDMIRDGVADVVLAGGIERILPINLLLDPVEEGIASEGAGVAALESLSHAEARNARIYGHVQGYARRSTRAGDEAWLIDQTLQELAIPRDQVGAVVVSRSSDEALAMLRTGLNDRGITAQLWPWKRVLGECYGAWTGLALAGACLKLEALPPETPTVLIVSIDPGQEGICLAVRRP